MSDGNMARFVADSDVLAADLLVGGDARAALDLARAHDWITVVASDALLDDAEAVITATTADTGLADAWRQRIEDHVEPVNHQPGDHPGLASAFAGDARHLLSFDENLVSPDANAALQGRLEVSIRTPGAFVSLFDLETMYDVVVGGEYPGPDRDPRA